MVSSLAQKVPITFPWQPVTPSSLKSQLWLNAHSCKNLRITARPRSTCWLQCTKRVYRSFLYPGDAMPSPHVGMQAPIGAMWNETPLSSSTLRFAKKGYSKTIVSLPQARLEGNILNGLVFYDNKRPTEAGYAFLGMPRGFLCVLLK